MQSTAATFDPKDFRRALGMFGTGVTIVTAVDPDGQPIFADRLAGTIEDLVLTLVDGATLKLEGSLQGHPSDARKGL